MQESQIHQLSAYLDGELSDMERDAIEQDLARSDTLRDELAKLRLVRDWLANYPGRRPRDDMWSSIATRIVGGGGRTAERKDRKPLPRRLAARVAALPVISWFGVVTTEIRLGGAGYEGTVRNGVETRDYASFGGSFVFLDHAPEEAAVSVRPLPITWRDDAVGYRGHVGRRVTFECPPDGSEHSLWGTDWYTDDSSICTAAVHAGLITFQDGGAVTIEMGRERAHYRESHRHGVESRGFAEWDGSFRFVDAPAGGADGAEAVEWLDWTKSARHLREWTGLSASVHCPAGGSPSSIWGTDLYTDDSSICTAAVHSGLITFARGGTVRVEIAPGASRYDGSNRFGVESSSFGEWDGSFRVRPAVTPGN